MKHRRLARGQGNVRRVETADFCDQSPNFFGRGDRREVAVRFFHPDPVDVGPDKKR